MKKMTCMLLAALLLLTGCQTAEPPETTVPEETIAIEEFATAPTVTIPIQTMPDLVIGGVEGEEMEFRNPGKARIGYTENRSYVRYITSVDQLPAVGSWTGYDESYFETKALLIVVETLNSGSVQVDWESILVEGDTAAIHIKRTMAGDVGTADMATWMLWAEVEAGLELNWVLANASQLPQGEKY